MWVFVLKYNIKLVLESSNLPSVIKIKDKSDTLLCQRLGNTITIIDKIFLPNRIIIDIECETPDQHLKLKELWLGGIKFNSDNLFSIVQYQVDGEQDCQFTTFLNKTGQACIELFDKEPIIFHLHWKNTITI
jgi:hypothetical protein